MLPGLHATLYSLVSNLSQRQQVHLNLFLKEVSDPEIESIRGTITDAGGVNALTFHQADLSDFKGLKSLQGDWMTYLRLYLPNLMPDSDTILYLDSDLIVNTDACAFFTHQLGDVPIAAVKGEDVQWNLDHHFLTSVGLADNDRSFNAGILVLNARLWREKALVDRALDFGRLHAKSLQSADQTILNALYSREFQALPPQFNKGVFAHDPAMELEDGIYHFIGSPKPWDPLGRLFHGNWRMWNSVIIKTRLKWSEFMAQHFSAVAVRAWTLRRSYARTFKRRRNPPAKS